MQRKEILHDERNTRAGTRHSAASVRSIVPVPVKRNPKHCGGYGKRRDASKVPQDIGRQKQTYRRSAFPARKTDCDEPDAPGTRLAARCPRTDSPYRTPDKPETALTAIRRITESNMSARTPRPKSDGQKGRLRFTTQAAEPHGRDRSRAFRPCTNPLSDGNGLWYSLSETPSRYTLRRL